MREEKLNKKKNILLSLCVTFFVAGFILIIWLFFINNRVYEKKYENDSFSLNYDNTWNIVKKEKNHIVLGHKTNSLIDIISTVLKFEYEKKDLSLIIDEIQYDIENQNTNYVLLKKEKTFVTKNNYDSYKLLYEDGDNQSLIIIIKSDKKLLTINYIAKNQYFDILLDSFQLVLGSIYFY